MSLAEDLKTITPEQTIEQVIDGLDDKDLVHALQDRGFLVHKDEPELNRRVKLDADSKGTVRFCVVSDTHLGNKHQQLTHWRHFMEEATEWGAEFCLHGGDVVDGGRMHRDQEFELFKHGSDAQGKYAVENIPPLLDKKGNVLPTYITGGNHDASFWNDAGANVIGLMADKREDLHFLGAPTSTFHISGLRVNVVHPSGGPSYARSYKPQKFIEQMPADSKPHIVLIGHYHLACHLPGYRNVEGFLVPCFESQTAYLRAKQLAPVIGGLLMEAEYNTKGLVALTTKWRIYHTPLEKDWP